MMCVSVTSKVDLALEYAGTYLAGERLESSVFTTVGDQVGSLTEGLATLTADIRLLP